MKSEQVITIIVLTLFSGMAYLLFGVFGVSELVGAIILFFWLFAIGYFGGEIAANL